MEAKFESLKDVEKNVALVIDEVKIKDSLVYDKHRVRIIGFVDVGDIITMNCSRLAIVPGLFFSSSKTYACFHGGRLVYPFEVSLCTICHEKLNS